MKTITINLYTFDELSDKAKEKARSWWHECGLDYEWWDSVYYDAATIGLKITEFGLDRNRHANGSFTKSATEVADLILKNHSDKSDTYTLAETFLCDRDEVFESAEKNENGDYKYESALDDKLDELESEFERALLEEYSIMLQKEYEYLLSDENVDVCLRINEYTFEENGKRRDE